MCLVISKKAFPSVTMWPSVRISGQTIQPALPQLPPNATNNNTLQLPGSHPHCARDGASPPTIRQSSQPASRPAGQPAAHGPANSGPRSRLGTN